MVNTTALRVKSEELEIPFANVFSGFVIESVIAMGAETSYCNDLWLCNQEDFGLDVYKKTSVRSVSYQYCGEKDLLDFVKKYGEDICRHFGEQDFLVKQEELKQDGQKVTLCFGGELEEKYIPFSVKFTKVSRSIGFPVEKHMRLFMENNKAVTVFLSPVEQILAEHFAYILKDLELLNEMEHYVLAFDILKTYPVEGRKIKNCLEQLCDTWHIPKNEKPYQLWRGYKDYTYMKKKWKVLLRKEKRSEPGWEEMFTLLEQFLAPIWEAICKEEIFFSDWMPEIARFLD